MPENSVNKVPSKRAHSRGAPFELSALHLFDINYSLDFDDPKEHDEKVKISCLVMQYPSPKDYIGFVDIRAAKSPQKDGSPGINLSTSYFYALRPVGNFLSWEQIQPNLEFFVQSSVWQKFRDFYSYIAGQAPGGLPSLPLIPDKVEFKTHKPEQTGTE